MVAVGISMRSLSFSTCNSRFMLTGLLVLVGAGLMSCASTEELYAQYDEQFCPVDGYGAVSAIPSDTTVAETKVVERVVIKEVPAASATMMTWEPAVYYNSDSTSLSKSAKRALDSNVKMLRKFPRHLVAIRGFTDAHSSVAYNRELAQKRIAGVKRYLTKKGIAGRRIVGTSHGESIPLASDQSVIADNINRRVELLLLDSDGRPVSSRQPIVLGPSEG